MRVPFLTVFTDYKKELFVGTFAALATFVLFYLMTVFTLSWGTTKLGFTRDQLLPIQMLGVVFFGLAIPFSAKLADRYGRQRTLMITTIGIAIFGFLFQPLFGAATGFGAAAFSIIGFALMGCTYGPLGTALSELFPTSVRYTGASLTFNLGGIVGASLAPYIATTLATSYGGLASVGYYMSLAAVVTALALLAMPKNAHLERQPS